MFLAGQKLLLANISSLCWLVGDERVFFYYTPPSIIITSDRFLGRFVFFLLIFLLVAIPPVRAGRAKLVFLPVPRPRTHASKQKPKINGRRPTFFFFFFTTALPNHKDSTCERRSKEIHTTSMRIYMFENSCFNL